MFIFVLLFRSYVIDRVIISGNSMVNTFNDSDVCWVKKFDYDIKVDDVIIAKINGTDVIKRVVAVPGDSVEIKDGIVYVNDEKYSGNYDYRTDYAGIASEKILLREDEYFILGDNREDSYDSRYYGAIRTENIKGIVIAKIFPFFKIVRG